eukprot:Opistho-2@24444
MSSPGSGTSSYRTAHGGSYVSTSGHMSHRRASSISVRPTLPPHYVPEFVDTEVEEVEAGYDPEDESASLTSPAVASYPHSMADGSSPRGQSSSLATSVHESGVGSINARDEELETLAGRIPGRKASLITVSLLNFFVCRGVRVNFADNLGLLEFASRREALVSWCCYFLLQCGSALLRARRRMDV